MSTCHVSWGPDRPATPDHTIPAIGPALRLDPGVPLRLTAEQWPSDGHLIADVLQQGPNHSRLELRWYTRDASEPRLVITIGYLPDVVTTFDYPLQYLDATTVFLPRTPGRLKATSIGRRIDPSEISHAELCLVDVDTDQHLLITAPSIVSQVPQHHLPTEPLLDELGQLTTRDWPDRCASAAQMVSQLTAAAADTDTSGPSGWSRWGGSLADQFEASGWFRVERDDHQRFWLVDPDGYGFFSAGVDCVNPGNGASIVPGAEAMHGPLPKPGEPFGDHYQANGARGMASYNSQTANLERAFGTEWRSAWETLTARRMRQWGFNTIGNWSNPAFAASSQLPWVRPLNGYPTTEVCLFRDLPDVFDPAFAEDAERYAQQLLETRDDRALIGYFMVNEPQWGFGHEVILAAEMLEANPGTHSRRALGSWLSERYAGDAAAWATAWGVDHAAFNAVETELFHRVADTSATAAADLQAFSAELVSKYVGIPAAALRAVDPNHLNLGTRWAWISTELCYETGKVADVFSINCYGMEPDIAVAAEAAKRCGTPLMIGEFHFGALDRGLTGTGLKAVVSQADRGAAYRRFVEVCAADPNIVGCHYFQYNDQSALGRFDGECWNIGLVDVCHQPYHELVDAACATHDRLYDLCRGEVEPVAASARELERIAF